MMGEVRQAGTGDAAARSRTIASHSRRRLHTLLGQPMYDVCYLRLGALAAFLRRLFAFFADRFGMTKCISPHARQVTPTNTLSVPSDLSSSGNGGIRLPSSYPPACLRVTSNAVAALLFGFLVPTPGLSGRSGLSHDRKRVACTAQKPDARLSNSPVAATD
jgi:hypothetical protein